MSSKILPCLLSKIYRMVSFPTENRCFLEQERKTFLELGYKVFQLSILAMSKTKRTTEATGNRAAQLKASIFAGSRRRQTAKIPTMITLPLALFAFQMSRLNIYMGKWPENVKIALQFVQIILGDVSTLVSILLPFPYIRLTII